MNSLFCSPIPRKSFIFNTIGYSADAPALKICVLANVYVASSVTWVRARSMRLIWMIRWPRAASSMNSPAALCVDLRAPVASAPSREGSTNYAFWTPVCHH